MASAREPQGAGKVLEFALGQASFALPAAGVLEVIRTPPITRVPLSPPSLAGVIALHGAVIPAIRLDRLLAAGAASGPFERIIVFDAGEPVGLLVEQVLGLAEAGQSAGTLVDLPALLAAQWGDAAAPRPPVLTGERGGAAPATAPPQAMRALLGFFVAGQHYALPLQAIREVVPLPVAIAEPAQGGAAVLGMMTVRQTELPLICLARLLGLAERGAPVRSHVVITQVGPWLVGLVTGAMNRLLHVPEASIGPVPPLLQGGVGDAEIDAIARLDGGTSLVSILAPHKLSDNRSIAEAMSGIEQEETQMPQSGAGTATEQFVVLSLGEERYGLPIGAVDEILHLPDAVTRLPNAPDFVAGVINLRGKPLPVIDQRRRFAVGGEGTARPRIVVVTLDQIQAGFIVDAVSEIVRVPVQDVLASPRLPGEGMRLFDRVTPVGTGAQVLLVVDPQELLDQAERELLAHFQSQKSSPT